MRSVVEIDVPGKSPEAVRDWWTADVPRGRELRVTFRGPLGVPIRVREVFDVAADGSWGFDTRAPMGLRIRDRFEARPRAGGGTRLRVTCDITGALAFAYAPFARRQFARMWREAARACEASR